MPTMTTTITDPQFARIVAALDNEVEREPGETDGAFVKRHGKQMWIDLVYRDDRRAGAAAVSPDNTLVTIT